jgi:hypothetical protein
MDGDLGACQWLSESMPVDTVGEALGRCGLGALSACDDLYLNTASSSQEELFGSTCGNRYARTDGYCVQLYG